MTIDTQKLRHFAQWIERRYPEGTAKGVVEAADHIDSQAAEIARLKKALRVAAMALAHATQEHGKVYRPAYVVVDAALSGEGK